MRMTPHQLRARLLANDASDHGRFFVGRASAGVYCLPSCDLWKNRKLKVTFFPTVEAARAAKLLPCKHCQPDDFALGAEAVLESIEKVVAEIRSDPAAFADARALVRRLSFNATRVAELFQHHYHTTPDDLLLRARLAVAKRALISSDNDVGEIVSRVGFDSLSAFQKPFHRFNGLTAQDFRALRTETSFTLQLPVGYLLGYLRRALSRDGHSVTERFEGDVYTTAVRLSSGPALLTLHLSPKAVSARVDFRPEANRPSAHSLSTTLTSPPAATEAHAVVVGLLGLDQDATAFVRLAKRLGLTRLTEGRHELRISQTTSIFEGVLWSIIGQQINFAFACLLRRRLMERAGTPWGNGLYIPPTPQTIAALKPEDLLPLQFSRQKADYVIGTARLIAEGSLDLDGLRTMSATRAERTLLAVRGLGPWSVNYVMMRSLGFPDCVPLGDTGVTSGLLALLELEERPDVAATKRLMARFSPYRSLATTHLWQFNRPLP